MGIASDFKPIVKYFIPNIDTDKTITYKGAPETKPIINWIKRTRQITSWERIDSISLLDKSRISTKLQAVESIPSYPLENLFIYIYDPALVTKEDLQVIPYLYQDLIESSPSTKFFLSNDSSNIIKIMEYQEKNLIKLLYDDKLDKSDVEFNEDKYHLNTITSLPTLINLKEHSLNSKIFKVLDQ